MANKNTSNGSGYGIDYSDERIQKVEAEKNNAVKESDAVYDQVIGSADEIYQQQIDLSKDWAQTQQDLQNQQTEQIVKEVNQQKDWAKQDYKKEQSGAYTDYQKQSNEYSVGAEQRAASGLSNTGYSESSQVAMYNTYQNRVATARESYNRAVVNYDNAITNARLQNSIKLAEIAYQAQQTQLTLALQNMQYNNQLLLDKANKKLEIDSMYYNRYQDVIQQINQGNAMAESIRQYNETMAFNKQQHSDNVYLAKKELEEKQKQNAINNKNTQKQLDLQKQQVTQNYDLALKELAEQIRQNAIKNNLSEKELAEMIRQFNEKMALEKQNFNSGGGGKKSGSKSVDNGGTPVKVKPDDVTTDNTNKQNTGSNKGNNVVNGTLTSTPFNNSYTPEVSMSEVLKLGRGPISATELASLIERGEVIAEPNANGVLTVRNNPNYKKPKNSLK